MSYLSAPAIIGNFQVSPGGHFRADRSRFGPPVPPYHTGTDWRTPKGTPVPAMIAGRVIRAGWGDNLSGYIVWILGDDGRAILFAHLDRLFVRAGDRVAADQLVAHTGNSGSALTGAHLHAELCIAHVGHRSATDCYRAGTLRDLMVEFAPREEEDMTDEQLDRLTREIVGAIKGVATTMQISLQRLQQGKDVVTGEPLEREGDIT